MNQILRCDWLPERARWSYLARSGLPAVSRKENFPENHMINPLLTKLVRSRSFLFCEFMEFMDLDSVSVHKHAKKELGQYPAILASHVVNNPHIFSRQMEVIMFIILQILFAKRGVLKTGEYHSARIFSSFSWGIFSHETCMFRPITRERKCLMDYKKQ